MRWMPLKMTTEDPRGLIVIVMKLESRVLALCSLEGGEVDDVDRRRLGDVIKGDDGPSVLGHAWKCLDTGVLNGRQ